MNITYPTTKDHGLKPCINNRAGQVISRHCNEGTRGYVIKESETTRQLCKKENTWARRVRVINGKGRLVGGRWGRERERERVCAWGRGGGEGFGRQVPEDIN